MPTRFPMLVLLGLVACTTAAMPPAPEPPIQAEVPMVAKWERRQLLYDRPYSQRRDNVERALERLGAREVEGTHTQATCLVLVPAAADGHGAMDSGTVAARWQRVTFRSERGIRRGYPDGVNWVVYEQLKKDILRLFATRNLDVQDNGFSVEVLLPAIDSAD